MLPDVFFSHLQLYIFTKIDNISQVINFIENFCVSLFLLTESQYNIFFLSIHTRTQLMHRFFIVVLHCTLAILHRTSKFNCTFTNWVRFSQVRNLKEKRTWREKQSKSTHQRLKMKKSPPWIIYKRTYKMSKYITKWVNTVMYPY